MKSRLLGLACATAFSITMPVKSYAALIQVDIVDSLTINLDISGTLTGTTPTSGVGILFIDTPVPGTVQSYFSNITGNVMLGSQTLTAVYSGFFNSPYDGSLQLRNSINGNIPLASGDILSGAATITFSSNHGMTQDMFDGAGLPVYWGSASSGVLQGYAQSPIPIPSVFWLFGSGFLGLVGVARHKK